MSAEKLPPDGYELGPGWKVGSGAPFCSTRRLPLGNCHRDVAYTNEGEAVGLCVMHSLLDGAIVRKAEAPTVIGSDWRCACGKANWAMHSRCIACAAPPPEQPSGNAGQLTCACGSPRALGVMLCPACKAESDKHHEGCLCLKCDLPDCTATFHQPYCRQSPERGGKPPEAPAAPVGEPSEARHLAHAFVTANRLDCEKERPSPEPRPEHFPLCDRLTDVIQRAIDPRDARIAALEAEVAEAKSERDQWKHAHGEAYKVAVGAAAAVQAERERASFYAEEAVQRRCGWRTAAAAIKNGDPAP